MGYKARFFGADAEAAARVLGIGCFPDHNFLTASGGVGCSLARWPAHCSGDGLLGAASGAAAPSQPWVSGGWHTAVVMGLVGAAFWTAAPSKAG